MKILIIVLLVNFYCLIDVSYGKAAGLNLSIYEKKKFAQQLAAQSLYNNSDCVIELTAETLKDRIYDQKYASFVEFYNSYCGFCRRFAPTWKEFAENVYPWRKIVQVGAIDCSVDLNNQICREFEVMAYPTIRYFSPNTTADSKNIGINIEGKDSNDLRNKLVNLLKNETNGSSNWPNLSPLEDINVQNIFHQYPDSVQYIFVIYESQNSNIGYEIALDLHSIKEISIKQVVNEEVANGLNLSIKPSLTVINRVIETTNLPIMNYNRQTVVDAIKNFIEKRGIKITNNMLTSSEVATIGNNGIGQPNEVLRQKSKKMKDVIFQADLEAAIRYTLFHEITKYQEIEGERYTALKEYVGVLDRYSPLGENGKQFLKELSTYLLTVNKLNGNHFETKIKELELKFNNKVFSSNQYVGCQSSIIGLRGFTCGLWLLFHYLTVQAAKSDQSSNPVEVLQAMHSYVQYFFGCGECSQHFQTMAAKNKIWNVTSKDNAILWLWNAHNEVNQRLSGDLTEDPEYPKVQFPTEDICNVCRKQSSGIDGIVWDKTEVILFLKRIHSLQNISHLGVDAESNLPIALQLSYVKQGGNIFSDVDIRMGLLLYIFCLCMMVIAIKLFLRRGYRKKIYAHDLLGKV